MPTKRRPARRGRPLLNPVRSFVARMLEEIRGISHKRALELVEADPDQIPGALWALGAEAHAAGVETLEDFNHWIRATISQHLTRPTI
jgi:hypothetical protein